MNVSAWTAEQRLHSEDPADTPVAESANDAFGRPLIRAPWFVVAPWVVFAVAYVTYQLIYLLPDLRAWFTAII